MICEFHIALSALTNTMVIESLGRYPRLLHFAPLAFYSVNEEF